MVWYWKTWNVQFCQAWGMTETNPIGTVSRMDGKHKFLKMSDKEIFQHIQKAGVPVPSMQIKIVDTEDFDKVLPRDGKAQGDLLVSGPWVCRSYFRGAGVNKFH